MAITKIEETIVREEGEAILMFGRFFPGRTVDRGRHAPMMPILTGID